MVEFPSTTRTLAKDPDASPRIHNLLLMIGGEHFIPMASMMSLIAAVQQQSTSCGSFKVVAHAEPRTPSAKRRRRILARMYQALENIRR